MHKVCCLLQVTDIHSLGRCLYLHLQGHLHHLICKDLKGNRLQKALVSRNQIHA